MTFSQLSKYMQCTGIVLLILFALSVFLYSQNLTIHGLEFRDDEVFYFKSTQEMVNSGNYLSPTYLGEHRWQKPILFYWMVLLSYKIFGINWIGARMVAVVFGALTVCLTWLIANELFNNKRVAWLSSLILMTVPLFFRHAKNVVPDMVLTFFIVWAVGCAVKFWRDPTRVRYQMWFFISCALGFMIKGFTAIIFPFVILIICALVTDRTDVLKKINFPFGIFIMLLIIAPWFVYMIKTYGQEYLNYMLVQETQNRVVTDTGEWGIVTFIKTFGDHILFYLEVIGSYFAPWSVFAIAALPFAYVRFFQKGNDRNGLLWILVWIEVVLVFYCSIYFAINHYMMALTVPMAIVMAYFLLYKFEGGGWAKFARFFRTFFASFIFVVSVLAYTFVHVFLLGASPLWLIPAIIFAVGVVVANLKRKCPFAPPMALALTLIFVFSQTHYLDKAGVTTHSTLQKFADTMSLHNLDGYTLSVGSHDIHEKGFQIYFDQPLIKAAGDGDENTANQLAELFAEHKRLYCLILQDDYDKHLAGRYGRELTVLQEEHIFRKRVYLDSGFLVSLVRMDQERIHDYLMERIILIKRN